MKYRKFGRCSWDVSEIGYGMWGMGEWSESDDVESLNSLQKSVGYGVNIFDTAWAYGNGHSERLLAKLIKQNPERRLWTATKIPPKNREWPSRRSFSLDDCYPPDHITSYVEKSLENLDIASIDLIQFHTWEDGWLADERWVKTMEDLRSKGIIKAVGISLNRWEPWNGVKAVRSGLVDAVQVIYNIFDQSPEDELFPACKEMNVAVIARVPFDEGTLTGQLTKDSKWPAGDWRNTYFVPENLSRSVEHAEGIKKVLPAGMSMPELALRFILSNPVVSTIIPGMRKENHVRSNVNCSDAGSLSPDLLDELKKHRWDRTPTAWSQ